MEQYLISKYGETEGKEILKKTNERIKKLLSNFKLTTSEKRTDKLKDVILPRIALYEILQEKGIRKQDAYEVVAEYVQKVICKKTKKQYKTMEKIPGFFAIFKRMFTKVTLNSDFWTSTLKEYKKDCFAVDITKCLWHDACVEAGCPEVCPLFCNCDDENYGGLKKLKFIRKGSLGKGSSVCDFKFEKTK